MAFLRRLFASLSRDTRGNVLAIVGAALVPLVIMIGSGIDLSRAYMAKAKMQSACDSASLAGRRVLMNDTLNQTVIDTATQFFNFNYPTGVYGTSPVTPQVTKPAAGVIRVTAAGTVPTSIMRMFGYDTLPVAVNCDAELSFVNTDITLVLDVTGSMNDSLSGTTKIASLRDAVMALYDELTPIQTQLQSQGLRLRYSVVPYSSTVNVGRLLYAQNSSYIRSTTTLPSRVAKMGNLTNYIGYGWYYTITGWTHRDVTYDVSNYITASGALTYATDNAGYIAYGNSTTLNPQDLANVVVLGNRANATWNGCIMERETNRSAIDGGTSLTIPSDAYDLDVNRIPNSDATRWQAMIPELAYRRTAGSTSADYSNYWSNQESIRAIPYGDGHWSCPAEARRLTAWTRAGLQTYLDSLQPNGGTYLDVGMIWGARFASTGGVFGDGCEFYNSMPCNRHIIFMTDGFQTAYCNSFTAYGIERNSMRVLGSPNCSSYDAADATVGQLVARHEQRFRMACNAAKATGASVWVIGFDTALSTDLANCASSSNQASTVANRSALIARFREIGNQIGALRLTR